MAQRLVSGISRTRQLRRGLLTACALVAWSGTAMAQEAGEPDEDIIVTGERALSGTKTDTPVTEIPQSVSVITAEDFTDRAAVNLQDVIRYSAGATPELNGVDTRGDFLAVRGTGAEQYLDGLNRMPGFIYGGRLEIFTIERAELLRGPSSTLYGGGGAGGILNSISKRPQETFGGEMGIIYGTDDYKQAQIDVTGPLVDGVSARLVGMVRDADLQQKGQKNDRIVVMPSVTLRPGPDTEVTFIGLYQRDKLGSQTYLPTSKTVDGSGATKISDDFYLGEPDYNHTHSSHYAFSLLVSHRFSDNLAFNSRNRAFEQDTDYQEVFGYTGFGGAYADAGRTIANRAWYLNRAKYTGLNSDNNLVLTFGTGPLEHQILGGFDYTEFREDKEEGFGQAPGLNLYNPVYGVPFASGVGWMTDTKNSQTGFYFQDQIRAWDRVSLVFGARHDDVKSNVNNVQLEGNKAWTFRAGIIADVVKGVSPYFNYSESFLPVFGSNFFGVAYVPRSGRQYEAGIKFQPTSRMLFTVAAYDIEEQNVLIADPNELQNFIQGGSTRSRGIEAEANVKLPGNLDLTASYSYTRAEYLVADGRLRGDRRENLPEHQASAWASKRFDLGGDLALKLGAGVRYQSDKVSFDQLYRVDPVTLADAMAELSYGKWSLSVNGSNIFNERVYTNCSYGGAPVNEGYCYLGKDRTVLGTLRRRF
ncbi:TonB-dependent siderophore receptor [Sphingomonas sp. HF-S4]|uniref:TonB-dependent siderophore receptor n=1 Tax=Sphingomonas agrestis TaxID=3080540 RepID=A0ABU3Y3K6_9SPHN|nr:TonB-dependent siderophore receptor [Sphingomonas sp. HF-S4]MDV3455980.1 TonB-dependent siderophore receptor [Sphingomonas sp. HF-S4]